MISIAFNIAYQSESCSEKNQAQIHLITSIPVMNHKNQWETLCLGKKHVRLVPT